MPGALLRETLLPLFRLKHVPNTLMDSLKSQNVILKLKPLKPLKNHFTGVSKMAVNTTMRDWLQGDSQFEDDLFDFKLGMSEKRTSIRKMQFG